MCLKVELGSSILPESLKIISNYYFICYNIIRLFKKLVIFMRKVLFGIGWLIMSWMFLYVAMLLR
ncbi:hypothetical protein ABD72_14690 [Brevibacillus laterosporus]|nr:hypothetical protein BrL25_08055 [Brevibacillus laterosporus DSM 25]MBG9803375.1 hypothetical protein [Brevibacillus laterosporus]